MTSNLDKFKAALESLIELGGAMDLDLTLRTKKKTGSLLADMKAAEKKIRGTFEAKYQRWYTEACAVVRQLIPDRLSEFESLYGVGGPKRKEIDNVTFSIQDWLNGVRSGTDYRGTQYYDDFAVMAMKFKTQQHILKSVEARFQSTLFDIRQLVQADLFDTELESARELIKHGFLRGAGAIAGVVLEKHLGQVVRNHRVTTRKKHPTISDLNDLLKQGSVMDIPTWRLIQRLGDIRNLCDHNKDRDPTKEEVEELVAGAEKMCKTLF